MRRLFALPFLAACLPAPALAEVPLPDSCQPRIAGVALAVADEAGEAQLTCDIDRAAIFQGRANAIFGPVSNPLVQVVDLAVSLSGAVYVYAVSDVQGAMILDARSVPADMDDPDNARGQPRTDRERDTRFLPPHPPERRCGETQRIDHWRRQCQRRLGLQRPLTA
jgi:hypothetical protein